MARILFEKMRAAERPFPRSIRPADAWASRTRRVQLLLIRCRQHPRNIDGGPSVAAPEPDRRHGKRDCDRNRQSAQSRRHTDAKPGPAARGATFERAPERSTNPAHIQLVEFAAYQVLTLKVRQAQPHQQRLPSRSPPTPPARGPRLFPRTRARSRPAASRQPG